MKVDHPVILFNDVQYLYCIYSGSTYKHLGITLDSKLPFSVHIQAAIAKSRKVIEMLKLISKYLSRSTLNELYKLYIWITVM